MPYKDSEEQKASQNRSYQRNKAKVLESTKRKREINRSYILELKRSSKCKCGENHPACLEFHHLDKTKKETGVSKAAMNFGLERLKKEISKCEIVCSNCHRKLHYDEADNFLTYKIDTAKA